jgi:hypothetical protein
MSYHKNKSIIDPGLGSIDSGIDIIASNNTEQIIMALFVLNSASGGTSSKGTSSGDNE